MDLKIVTVPSKGKSSNFSNNHPQWVESRAKSKKSIIKKKKTTKKILNPKSQYKIP
jgi:hypothetical protein